MVLTVDGAGAGAQGTGWTGGCHQAQWVGVSSALARTLRQSAAVYGRLRLSRTAAALAFYGLFSLGPLLVIAFAVTGWLVGGRAAEGLVATGLGELVGPAVAETLDELLVAIDRGGSGVGATVIAGLILFYVGSTVFFQLQAALAEVFEAPAPAGWRVTIWRRMRGFAAILTVSLVLATLVATNLAVAAASDRLDPGGWWTGSRVWILLAVGALSMVGLVMAMYRWFTIVRLPWKAIRSGATVTAALVLLGIWLAGLYFSTLGIESGAYAAFPLLVLLALLNYVGQALLFGAALTKTLADRSTV